MVDKAAQVPRILIDVDDLAAEIHQSNEFLGERSKSECGSRPGTIVPDSMDALDLDMASDTPRLPRPRLASERSSRGSRGTTYGNGDMTLSRGMSRASASSAASSAIKKYRLLHQGSRDHPLSMLIRVFFALLVLLASVTSVVLLTQFELDHDGTRKSVCRKAFWPHAIVMFLTAFVFVTSLASAVDIFFRLNAAYAFFTWLQVWSRVLHLGYCNDAFSATINLVVVGAWALSVLTTFTLAYSWVQALQFSSQGTFQAHTNLGYWFKLVIAFLLPELVLVSCAVFFDEFFMWLAFVNGIGLFVAGMGFWSTAIFYFCRVHNIAVEVVAVTEGQLKQEALAARLAARFRLFAIFLSAVTMAFHYLTYASLMRHVFDEALPTLLISNLVDAVGNMITKFALSGPGSWSFYSEIGRAFLEYGRLRVQARMRKTWRKSSSLEWHAKLEKLALRGFTLDALLKFYKGLGTEYMLDFDGNLHTTSDVTRAAIIPLSSESGVAYAEIMMGGQPTRAKKFVTHWWGNRFRSLVAAIVADAMDEAEFAMIEYLLDNGIEHVEAWVAGMGLGSKTYWVCCFSVNQHAGICGKESLHYKDSVTGLVHPVCKCSHAKAWNGTPPLYKGKSIPCEMNKFDDMLAFMAAKHRVKHIIAVDPEFRLFTRAWCVAELAVGAQMGLKQRMRVHSKAMLNKHIEWLSHLRIKEMEASRPEDKQEILSKIDDTEEFDRRLHKLLTQRLFPGWRSLNRTAQMQRIGSLARWHMVSRSPELQGIWHAMDVAH